MNTLPQPVKHWSMKTAIEQIAKCGFECEGGPLANNDAWRWLVDAAEVGPEFWPGQGVYFEVVAETAGIEIKQWRHFYIVGAEMGSDTERRFWRYTLSDDVPSPWHYGKVSFIGIRGDKLRLEKPKPDAAA